MNSGEIIIINRAGEILRDVGLYIDELANDEWHDRWERWTARMDEVNEELHELLDIIAELECKSKMRMLAKTYKALASIRNCRRMASKAETCSNFNGTRL